LPRAFAAVGSKFHTPWVSILFFSVAVWALAITGTFTWNVTLSVVARLFYYGVVSAALISLRRKRTATGGLRLPFGPLWSIMGAGIALVLFAAAQISGQMNWSKSLILGATVGAALLNWAWARYRKPA
jgi:basic amino acid/polyamine antiporter, APA family